VNKIGSQTDSQGRSLDVYHANSLSLCPALSLFLKVYAEILDQGFANPNVAWRNKSSMVWAQLGDKVVGGICYEYEPETRMGWIVLSFTDPEYRGSGINGILHEFFEAEVKKIGGARIASLIHVDNASRIRSAEKVGLLPQFYRTLKILD
jgi:GNAT superfamily N-acetyltransferase